MQVVTIEYKGGGSFETGGGHPNLDSDDRGGMLKGGGAL